MSKIIHDLKSNEDLLADFCCKNLKKEDITIGNVVSFNWDYIRDNISEYTYTDKWNTIISEIVKDDVIWSKLKELIVFWM